MKERTLLGYYKNRYLYYPGEGHGLIVGAPRSGKGNIITRIGLTRRGSLFSVDSKGANAVITSAFRHEILGQEIYNLNPFGMWPKQLERYHDAKYNPLLSDLDILSTTFANQADALAAALLPRVGPDPHWIDAGRRIVAGVCMALRYLYDGPSLVDVYEKVSGPELFEFVKDAVRNCPPNSFVKERLSVLLSKDAAENKEILCIISAAITNLAFIGNFPIANCLSESTIDFRKLATEAATVNLILPGEYSTGSNEGRWFRLMANSFFTAMLKVPRKKVSMLAVLDEFVTTVGDLEIVKTLMTLGAGYGIQLLNIVTNMGLLEGLFGKGWETFLGAYTIFLNCNDLMSAEYASRLSGTISVPVMSRNGKSDPSMPVPNGAANVVNQFLTGNNSDGGYTINQQAKRYVMPEDVHDLSGEMLVIGQGISGIIRASNPPYYTDPNFAGMFDTDPYHDISDQEDLNDTEDIEP